MSSEDVGMLKDMGFSESRAEKALEITGNKGVEVAMEWLLAHSDEAEPSPEPPTAESAPAPAAETPSQDSVANTSAQVTTTEEAKSTKCDICGKLFSSTLEIEYHVTKSGHDQFSESTEEKRTLSEDERREQVRVLQEKIKQKSKEREELEKKTALEREKYRIKSGKQMTEARKKLEEIEMKKLLEDRKREKEEEMLARQRVKAQIEADKAARHAKAEAVQAQQLPPAAAAVSTGESQNRKNFNETKLLIRLTNGETMVQRFGSKEQLSAVRLFIEINRTDGQGPFNLMTSFPKKIFTDEDYDAPLEFLGLVPSAVVIVQKKVE